MIKTADKIYFIGIGGIGMSAAARMYLGLGRQVFGSDMRDSVTVQELIKLGVRVTVGHSPANIIQAQPDLVVYTEDISPDSLGFAELKQAQDLNIETAVFAKALGQLMDGRFGISITGTNGKSTTTAILGLILEAAGLDPSVIVGSKLSVKNESGAFKANARIGQGKYFVAEADEYHRHMMEQSPSMIIVTNVAEDHLDYYKDLTDIKNAFSDFIKKLPADGVVIYNADDHESVEVGRRAHCHKMTFGIHHYADLQAVNVRQAAGRQEFDLHYQDQNLGHVEVSVPGLFNISNILGAAAGALRLGVSFEVIQKTLKDFAGIWRRFETVGRFDSTAIISDYEHHPAGVIGTIHAAKEFYPGKKILFVFQPHHRNRTKKLLGEFVDALAEADSLIVQEIFDVVGREHGEAVSSTQIVDELKNLKVSAEYSADLKQTEELIRQKHSDFDVIVMMGAGDIDLLARKLVS